MSVSISPFRNLKLTCFSLLLTLLSITVWTTTLFPPSPVLAMVCMENEESNVIKEEGEECGGPCNLHGRCKEGFHCVTMNRAESNSPTSKLHGNIRINHNALVDHSSISKKEGEVQNPARNTDIMLNSMVGVPTTTGICQSKSTIELMWSRETHMDKETKQKPYHMENFADSNENMFNLFAKVVKSHNHQTKDNKDSRSLLSDDVEDSVSQGLVGGLTTIDVNNDEVEKAASAAVELMVANEIIKENELGVLNPSSSEEGKMVVVKKAYSQVVSGIKYYLVLALKVNNRETNFDVVIISQPWMDPAYTLLSVKEEGSDEELL